MNSGPSDVPAFLTRYYENYTRSNLARLILNRLAGTMAPSRGLSLLEPLLTDAPRARLIEWLVLELLARLSLYDEWSAYVAAKTEDLQVLWGMDEERASTGAVRQAVGLGLRPAQTARAAGRR